MPLQRVYGKRSRPAFDPFEILDASPPQSWTAQKTTEGESRHDELEVGTLVEQVSQLKLTSASDAKTRERIGRKVLSERNANGEVRTGAVPVQEIKEGRRRPRRRIALSEEDGEDEGDQAVTEAPVLEPTLAKAIDLIFEESPSQAQHSIRPYRAPEKDIYTTHCAELLALSAHPISPFVEWSDQLSTHFDLAKIAEASFGEVYRLSLRQELAGFSPADESVLKVIALRGPEAALPRDARRRAAALRKAEGASRVGDVANEVRLLQRMSSIPGFTNFRDVRVVRGRPAGAFVPAFAAFDAAQRARRRDPSLFPDPAKRASYGADQLWAVIEMQDAGTDLERVVEGGGCTGVWAVWDVFWQVVLALAKGEEGARFEHRDLHLGNICVRAGSGAADASPGVDPEAIDISRKLHFTNLDTTIIDYTISRCGGSAANEPDETEDQVAYHDLSAPSEASLFQGDSTHEYQYDIYRYMRSAVFLRDALADFPGPGRSSPRKTTWSHFHPVTNLIWLHFLLHQLLAQIAWPSARRAPAKKKQQAGHSRWKRANELERALRRVRALLEPAGICGGEVGSASDLVGWALAEGWLGVEDIVDADGVGGWDAEDGGGTLVEGGDDRGVRAESEEATVTAAAVAVAKSPMGRSLRKREHRPRKKAK